MKTLLTLFVLLFSSSVVAEDISDFQIEGISIGDTLLDYFNEEEINSFRTYEYVDKKFYSMDLLNTSLTFKIYDGMQVQLKTKDKKYILHGMSGLLIFKNNEFNQCMEKLKIIKKDISNLFINYTEDEYKRSHPDDSNSKGYSYEMINNSGIITLRCLEWSKKYAKDLNLFNTLRVSAWTNDFAYWLQYKAY